MPTTWYTVTAPLPDSRWATEGRELAAKPHRVVVRGGIGLRGYFAGPDVHIVDEYGLADPLLSRLPVPDAQHELAFRAGHIRRNIPEGYLKSLQGKGQIDDPGVRHYAAEIARVTRGSLWSWHRLVTLARLELGLDRGQLANWIAWSSVKRITLGKLDHHGGEDRHASYTYWARDSKKGVLFTDTGVRVVLPEVSHVARWTAALGPGAFQVVPMRGHQRLHGIRTAAGPGISKRRIELPAATASAGYDDLLFLPVRARATYDELDNLRTE